MLKGDASFSICALGSETHTPLLPEPNVPQVANRAPRRGKREGTEDPVHVPEGTLRCRFAYLVNGIFCIYYKRRTHVDYFTCVFCGVLNIWCYKMENGNVITSANLCVFCFVFFFNFRPSSLWTSIHYHSNQLKRQKFFRTLGTESVKYWTKNCSVTTEITVNHNTGGLGCCKAHLSALLSFYFLSRSRSSYS